MKRDEAIRIVSEAHERSERANLRGADLRWANLRGADLRWANLRGANLREADLRWANLRWADLSGANLREANLRGANLRGADLRGANLREADLSGANLRGADLRWANLREANLPPPTMILLASWGELPPALCSLAMRFDAAAHRNPSAFDRWAAGGPCPYADERFERAVNFRERKRHWNPEDRAPLLRPWDLMVDLLRSCCRDSDYHVGGATTEGGRC